MSMQAILEYELGSDQAALWFLGQSGFILRSGEVSIAIDPYLSDSVAKVSPGLARQLPVPMAPEELQVDMMLITHDHLDHLDPETLGPYAYKRDTYFVAPRLACRKLAELDIPEERIQRLDTGERLSLEGVTISGIYARPNEAAVLDTCGFLVEFANGRSVYHSGDTGFDELLTASAPAAETVLVCINGKGGNLNVDQATELILNIQPRYALGHHYDLMRFNAEDPETLAYYIRCYSDRIEPVILEHLEAFVWEN